MPTLILAPEVQAQKVFAPVSGSEFLPEARVMPPNLIGKMQLQQTSVTGLMILPRQAASAEVLSRPQKSVKMKRKVFIDAFRGG